MCRRESVSDRERLARVAGRERPGRETAKSLRRECTSASLLGLANASGKKQLDGFSVEFRVRASKSCAWSTFSIRLKAGEILSGYFSSPFSFMFPFSVRRKFRFRSGLFLFSHPRAGYFGLIRLLVYITTPARVGTERPSEAEARAKGYRPARNGQ